MPEYVCNYSLIRFLPYRDAGEFVNIGVALACGALSFLDFRIEPRRYARVTHFFPELEPAVYRDGLRALQAECDRWHEAAARLEQRNSGDSEAILRHIFGELTRAHESVFHFDAPRALLVSQPSVAIEELFTRYVRRQFPQEKVQGEEAMRRHIAESLREFGVEKSFRPARIGTLDYNIQFPFVEPGNQNTEQPALPLLDNAQRAIKPLNLDRSEPSEITQHGDDWYMRVRRLRASGHLPPYLLFPVQKPQHGTRRIAAADKVRLDLESLGVETASFDNMARLKEFTQNSSRV